MTGNLEIQRKAEKLAIPSKIIIFFLHCLEFHYSKTQDRYLCICKTIWVGGGGLWVGKH